VVLKEIAPDLSVVQVLAPLEARSIILQKHSRRWVRKRKKYLKKSSF